MFLNSVTWLLTSVVNIQLFLVLLFFLVELKNDSTPSHLIKRNEMEGQIILEDHSKNR